jgi:hypothetical protein
MEGNLVNFEDYALTRIWDFLNYTGEMSSMRCIVKIVSLKTKEHGGNTPHSMLAEAYSGLQKYDILLTTWSLYADEVVNDVEELKLGSFYLMIGRSQINWELQKVVLEAEKIQEIPECYSWSSLHVDLDFEVPC